MTATLSRPENPSVWSTMPGWGIVADLTPPEIVASRKLRGLRKVIAFALVVVLLGCAGLYGYAYLQSSAADDGLAAANDQTTVLTATQAKYSGVTQIQTRVAGVDAQISSLMADEVDMSALLANLRSQLPGTMAITSMTVSISGSAGGVDATSSLDTSGQVQIGSVTVAGTEQSLNDLAEYVTNLSSMKGVINVVPTSNSTGDAGGGAWNANMQVTEQLYTKRYAATGTTATTGGN